MPAARPWPPSAALSKLRAAIECSTITKMTSTALVCDGCGQTANEEHIARRLKRLENMTRYRPVHVQALFLGAVAPEDHAAHLYSAESGIGGEGAALLEALDMAVAGRSVEALLSEFQRCGYLLTHVLECPVDGSDARRQREMLERRFARAIALIRRSYKPKRLVLLGEELDGFATLLAREDLGGELVLSRGNRAFRLAELAPGSLLVKVTAPVTASL